VAREFVATGPAETAKVFREFADEIEQGKVKVTEIENSIMQRNGLMQWVLTVAWARTSFEGATPPTGILTPVKMGDRETVKHSILLRNGGRLEVDCYVTKIAETGDAIYEPVDKLTYREDTRLNDLERTYLLPGEGISASEQYLAQRRK
jgi:hypothetical protein